MSESFGAVTKAAGLIGGAVTAAGAAIVALGVHGSAVADVKDAFGELTRGAGEAADVMLGKLREGTLGTISNFDLMKLANKALGTGLITSSQDMGTLAAGAKLLADRTGGDTKEAFETLTSAMASGRTAQLKQLGLFVDSKVAVEAFALKLGKSVSDLTDHQRATALSQGALSALKKELEASGGKAADFSDNIDRAKVFVENFVDNLSVAIATSPVVAAGMEAMGKALTDAFGGKQQDAVKTLTELVGKFAIGLTYVGQVGVVAGTVIVTAWSALQTQVLAVLTVFAGAAAAIVNLIPGQQALAGALKEVTLGLAAQTAAAARAVVGNSDMHRTLDKMGGTLINVRGAMEEALKAGDKLGDGLVKKPPFGPPPPGLELNKKALEELTKSMEAFFATIDKNADARAAQLGLLGPTVENATIEMGRLWDATEKLGGVTALTDAQLVQLIDKMRQQIAAGGENAEGYRILAKAMQEAADRGGKVAEAAGFATPKLQEMSEAAKKAAEAHARLVEKVHGVTDGLRMLADLAGGMTGDLINWAADAADSFAEFGLTVDTAAAAMAGLGNVIEKKGTPNAYKMAGALKGAASGMKIGAAVAGPYGAAIGAVAGAIGGFILGGQKMIKMLNDTRDAFFAAHGGFEQMGADLVGFGVAAERVNELTLALFNADTPEEYAAAVAAVNAEFDAAKDRLDALKEGTDKVKEAMEKYGLTVDQMGPRFAQQQLDEQALKLVEDYRLLIAAGADNVAVLTAMGPAMNEYVNSAIAAGSTVPEAMRAQIEKMIEMGLLLDENGVAFTSVEDAGISFAETLTEGITRAVDAINRLVDALLGVQETAGRGIDLPVNVGNVPGGGPPSEQNIPEFQHGSDLTDFGSGSLAMLHDREWVVTESQGESLAAMVAAAIRGDQGDGRGSSGGAPTVDVKVYVAGEQFDALIERRIRAGFIKVPA